jgi:hypothetical protein
LLSYKIEELKITKVGEEFEIMEPEKKSEIFKVTLEQNKVRLPQKELIKLETLISNKQSPT